MREMAQREQGGQPAPAGARAPVVVRNRLWLARTVGNRAFSGLVVARQSATEEAPAATTSDIGAWIAAQGGSWQTLVAARDALEQAADGQQVTLTGEQSITVERTPALLDQVRRETRHRLMELLHRLRGPLTEQLDQAGDGIDARAAAQQTMRDQLAPILDALRSGRPASQRFEYPQDRPDATAIVASALAVSQLVGEGNAEAAWEHQQRTHDDAAHQAAMRTMGWSDSSKAWCGAFAYTMQRGAGLSGVAAGAMGATGPPRANGGRVPGATLDAFFQYIPAREIKDDDGTTWTPVEAYHATRGSQRMWQVLPGGGADFERDTRAYEGAARGGQVASIDDLDIQPGDVVVIDNNRGTYGDHITQCRSYNRSTHMLQTIGGNEGGAHPVNIGRWHTLDENPEPVANKHSGDGHARVYAVGRFSAVDYETHDYRAPPRGH